MKKRKDEHEFDLQTEFKLRMCVERKPRTYASFSLREDCKNENPLWLYFGR